MAKDDTVGQRSWTELEIVEDMQGKLPARYGGQVRGGNVVQIGVMPRGMASGKPSVGIVIDVDGKAVYAETSLALLLTAADFLKARHGDPRVDQPPPAGDGN